MKETSGFTSFLSRPGFLRAILVACLCVCSCWASTTNKRAKVLAVKQDEKGLILVVQSLWGSKLPMDEPQEIRVAKHAKAFLDGQAVDHATAFKPGHTFRAQVDSQYYECYSSAFTFPDAQASDSSDGVYRLSLKGAGKSIEPARRGDGEVKRQYDLFLHLEVRGGKIVAAGASGLFLKNNSIPSLPVDAEKLEIADGVLRGTVAISLLSRRQRMPMPGVGRLVRTLELELPLGPAMKDQASGAAHSALSGQYSGSDPHGSFKGAIVGQRSNLPDRSTSCTIWFGANTDLGKDMPTEMAGKAGQVSFRLQDGQFVDGLFSATKGYATGLTQGATVQIDGNTMSGTVTCSDAGRTLQVEFKAQIIGHLIVGTCSLGGKEGRIRGGVYTFEAAPFVNWKEKVVSKWLQNNPGQVVPKEAVLPAKKK